MNFLKPFDYVAFLYGSKYAEIFDYEEQKEFIGALILTIFQQFNFLTLVGLGRLSNITGLNQYHVYWIAAIPFLIFNLIRYYKFVDFNDCKKKWDNENVISRRLKQIGVIIYSILSFVLLVVTGDG